MNETLLHFAGYAAGVCSHVAFKWCDWRQEHGDWLSFGKQRAGMTGRNAITALVLFGAWQSGMLTEALGVTGMQVDVTFASSVFAGYVLDSIGKNLIPGATGAKT